MYEMDIYQVSGEFVIDLAEAVQAVEGTGIVVKEAGDWGWLVALPKPIQTKLKAEGEIDIPLAEGYKGQSVWSA